MKLKTFVINLEKSIVRRQYMENLLAPYSFLEVEFIKAINGRLLSEEERHLRFDYDESRNHYGKVMNAGEIGCALSHRKVYEELLKSNEPYALVLEDDISIIRDLSQLDLDAIDSVLNAPRPKVVLLSGDFGYYRKKPISRVFIAVGAYAYIINKAAARMILSITPPYCLADDWMAYKRHRLRLFAVNPYMIDANTNMEILGSDVKQDIWSIDRSKMSFKENLIRLCTGSIEKLFRLFNHYEYKIRIYNNTIVERLKNPFR